MHLYLGTHSLSSLLSMDKLPPCLSKDTLTASHLLLPHQGHLSNNHSSSPASSSFSSLISFPSAYKPLYCLPSFKRTFFDPMSPISSCPHLSILSFIEKFFERVVCIHCLHSVSSNQASVPTAAPELLLARSPMSHTSPNPLAFLKLRLPDLSALIVPS